MALNQGNIDDEAAIVRRARSGDRGAFNQLIDNSSVLAYRIAFSILQNQSDAEDAVQEAFITAFKSIKKLEKDTAFRSWMGRIVTTRAYDVTRQRQKNKRLLIARQCL